MVSHELRTPLTSISGALDLVLNVLASDVNEKQRRYLMLARDSTEKLNAIVDDLLDLAKFAKGRLRMNFEWTYVDELVRRSVEKYGPAFLERQIKVSAGLPQHGLRALADPNRLTQVLNNLLTNAVKFTPEGGEVRLELRATSAVPGYLMLSCWNSGEPIAEENLERIFDRFEQARTRANRTVRGTGLGLAICRNIVEAPRRPHLVRAVLGWACASSWSSPWSPRSRSARARGSISAQNAPGGAARPRCSWRPSRTSAPSPSRSCAPGATTCAWSPAPRRPWRSRAPSRPTPCSWTCACPSSTGCGWRRCSRATRARARCPCSSSPPSTSASAPSAPERMPSSPCRCSPTGSWPPWTRWCAGAPVSTRATCSWWTTTRRAPCTAPRCSPASASRCTPPPPSRPPRAPCASAARTCSCSTPCCPTATATTSSRS